MTSRIVGVVEHSARKRLGASRVLRRAHPTLLGEDIARRRGASGCRGPQRARARCASAFLERPACVAARRRRRSDPAERPARGEQRSEAGQRGALQLRSLLGPAVSPLRGRPPACGGCRRPTSRCAQWSRPAVERPAPARAVLGPGQLHAKILGAVLRLGASGFCCTQLALRALLGFLLPCVAVGLRLLGGQALEVVLPTIQVESGRAPRADRAGRA